MARPPAERHKSPSRSDGAAAVPVVAEVASAGAARGSAWPSTERVRRLAPHVLSALILIVAAHLRLTGFSWGDAGMHPDERGIYMRMDGIHLLPPDPSVTSLAGRLLSSVDVNLRHGAHNAQIPGDQPDLNPEHFAYGSLPYLMGVFASWAADALYRDSAWGFLGGGALLIGFALAGFHGALAGLLSRRLWKTLDETRAGAVVLRGGLILAAAGLLLCLLVWGAHAAMAASGPHHTVLGYAGQYLVARPLSALCGVLTVLVLYRIGCRFFDPATGLLAAVFLTSTVLHIQLSHYFAVDTVLGLFAAASVLYCSHMATRARFSDFLWAGFFIGCAIATKFSAVLLPPLYVLAFALSWYGAGRERALDRSVAFFAGGVICVGTVLAAQPFAYLELSPPYALMTLGTFTLAFLWILNLVCTYRVWCGSVTALVLGAVLQGLLCGLDASGVVMLLAYGWAVQRRWRAAQRLLRTAVAAGVLFLTLFAAVRSGREQARGLPTFFGPGPLQIAAAPEYPYVGSLQFRHDIQEQSAMARGSLFVWTIQYEHTPPLTYHADNLLRLGMGPPLGLLCLIGLTWFVWRAFTTWHRPSLVVAAWLLANILVIGTFQTKFLRYMAPVLPFLSFAGAAFVRGMLGRR